MSLCRCGRFHAFFPARPDWEPEDPLVAALAAKEGVREPTPPWLRLFQLSSRAPWWLAWRHAPVSCDQCGQRVAFASWTRPRFSVYSHNILCLVCGYTQVGYVYTDGGKQETPVAGAEWSPPCVAVARLRRAIFDQQRIWVPPTPAPAAPQEDDDEDGDEDDD